MSEYANIVTSKEMQKILGIPQTTLIRAKQRGDIPYMIINVTHRYSVDKVFEDLEEKTKKKKST